MSIKPLQTFSAGKEDFHEDSSFPGKGRCVVPYHSIWCGSPRQLDMLSSLHTRVSDVYTEGVGFVCLWLHATAIIASNLDTGDVMRVAPPASAR